ncbi:MAG: UvrB/UvrC motif-containing protein, partial [Elusimicrobia bacterium]|nr:UvrB/UvrC motif-containing protein [Elusimicrobiota bacterium]
ITPRTIVKAVEELEEFQSTAKREGLMLLRDAERPLTAKDLPTIIEEVETRMRAAADALDFEAAVLLRDQLFELKSMSASRPAAGRAKKKR